MAKTTKDKNLIENGKATQFKSGEQAAENGRKGGIASGKAKKEKKALADIARMLLETDASEYQKTKMGRMGVDADNMTHATAVVCGLMAKAEDGDVSAAKYLAELTGQDPRLEMQKEELELRKGTAEDNDLVLELIGALRNGTKLETD